MKEIKNSKNTENPYELIAGIELCSKKRKKMRISIQGVEYKANPGKKILLDATKFAISDLPEVKFDDEIIIADLYKKIESFVNICNNPLEVITIFIDAYKMNKKLLNIKFKTIPVYGTATDSKFVYKELIG